MMKKIILLISILITQASHAGFGWFIIGTMVGKRRTPPPEKSQNPKEESKKVVLLSQSQTCFITFLDKWNDKQTVNTSYIVSIDEDSETNCVQEKIFKKCSIEDSQVCLVATDEKKCTQEKEFKYTNLKLINDETYTIKTSIEEFNQAVAKN